MLLIKTKGFDQSINRQNYACSCDRPARRLCNPALAIARQLLHGGILKQFATRPSLQCIRQTAHVKRGLNNFQY